MQGLSEHLAAGSRDGFRCIVPQGVTEHVIGDDHVPRFLAFTDNPRSHSTGQFLS